MTAQAPERYETGAGEKVDLGCDYDYEVEELTEETAARWMGIAIIAGCVALFLLGWGIKALIQSVIA